MENLPSQTFELLKQNRASIIALVALISTGALANLCIGNEVKKLQNGYEFKSNDQEREQNFRSIFETAFPGQSLPDNFNFRIGTSDEEKRSSGITPWVNISNSYYNSILKLEESYQQEEDEAQKAKILARLQVILSAMVFHEQKHVQNQEKNSPFVRNITYYARYQLDSNFRGAEEISATSSQISALRNILGVDELSVDHLNELFPVICYAEFAGDLGKIEKTPEFLKLKKSNESDSTLDILALYILDKYNADDLKTIQRVNTSLDKVGLTEEEKAQFLKNFPKIRLYNIPE